MAAPYLSGSTPVASSTNQSPSTTIGLGVADADSNLDNNSVQVKVNGVIVFHSGQTPKFFNGYTGTYAIFGGGMAVSLQPPAFFGDGEVVSVNVQAKDLTSNSLDTTFTFTTYAAPQVTQIDASGVDVKITFDPKVKVDGELFRPSNYGFSVRHGRARDTYARHVTSPDNTPGNTVQFVIVRLRDFLSLNGKYAVSVQGVHDEFGRTLNIQSSIG